MDLRDVLLALVNELADLQANQAVLSRFANAQGSLEAVQIAKDQALKDSREYYDKLRRQIEGLAL